MNKELRVLLINESGNRIENLIRWHLSCEVDCKGDVTNVRDIDALKYNVAIIDASDDFIVDGYHSLSEYLKLKNSDIIIIGTSIRGQYFEQDELSKQLYDERIDPWNGSFIRNLKETLTKYGFEFPVN